MKFEAGDARNAAMPARSSGSPQRPAGVRCSIRSCKPGIRARPSRVISVSMKPGRTALTWMLSLAHAGDWVIQFNGHLHGQWRSPDAAAIAVAQHQSGLPEWDREQSDASNDLLDWRPLGESL